MSASATFVRDDGATQGDWVADDGSLNYGRDGYALATGTSSLPSYVTMATAGAGLYTWDAAAPGVIVRAMRTGPSATAPDDPRLAACWYTTDPAGLDVDLNFTDGQTHQVAFYLLDYDTWYGRAADVTVRDASTSTVLDGPRAEAGYADGRYVVYDVAGHVTVHFTTTGVYNTAIGGIFFDPTTAPSPAAVATAARPLPQVSGPAAAVEGTPYTLALANANAAAPVDHWVINWGDNSDPDADGHVGQAVAGTAASVAHTYTTPSPAGGFRVTATAYDAADEAVAHAGTTGLGLDDTFAPGSAGGTGGVAAAAGFQASAVARDPVTGRVAVAGNGFVSVLTAAGDADVSFAGTGSVSTPSRVMAVAFDSSGKLWAAGYAGGDLWLARYATTGLPDGSFGTAGRAHADFGGGYDAGIGLALVPAGLGGGAVVAGETIGGAAAGGADLAVAKFTSAGALDTTFGTGGKVQLNLGGWNSAQDVAVTSTGGLLVSGTAYGVWAVAKLTPAGALDTAFGGGTGVAYLGWTGRNDVGTALGTGDPTDVEAGLVDVETDSGGKVVLAGPAGTRIAVARLNADGTPDATFGTNGRRSTAWWVGYSRLVRLRRDTAGRLVLAFDHYDRNPAYGGRHGLAVARLTADGTPDPGFGVGGLLDTGLWATEPSVATEAALSVADDGTVTAAGLDPATGAAAVRVRPANTVLVSPPPSSAMDLAVGGTTGSTALLTWTAPASLVAAGGVGGYDVYRGGQKVGSTTAETAFVDVGLKPSTSYTYTVWAKDAAGNAVLASNAAAATTTAAAFDATPPARPTWPRTRRAASPTARSR